MKWVIPGREHEGKFWDAFNILHVDSDDGYTGVLTIKNNLLCSRLAHFTVCMLYFNLKV